MKKILAFALSFILIFALIACGAETNDESSAAQSQESETDESSAEESSKAEDSSEPDESSEDESSAEEPKTYFDFTETAKSVSVNGSIASEDVVVFTTNEAIASGNAKWSVNVLLDKEDDCLYKVVSATPGDGNNYAGTLAENQVLLAVHSSSSDIGMIDEFQNIPGKLAAAALVPGDLIAIVGIEQNDIQKLKVYEEGEELVYKLELPVTLPNKNFVSFGAAVSTSVNINEATSIALTKINAAPAYGDSALYTYEYGLKLGDYDWSNYAVLVCKYDHTVFGYVQDKLYDVSSTESKKDIEIPDDGFVLAVSKDNDALYKKLANIKSGNKFFVHGVQVTPVEYSVKASTTAPVIDGSIGLTEWEEYLIETIDENNVFWDYSQFEVNQYEITAKIYATYDADNLYFAVVVDTPDAYCPVTSANASSMYAYCCIQVNIVDQSPLSDYMLSHYDHIIDTTAVTEGHIRQYGFAVNENGDTVPVVWMGANTTFTGSAKVVRDADAEQTIYEVSVPWAEIGLETVESGADFGLSISINTTNKTDAAASKWKNIKLRDGGGIILRNDWAKIPVCTLD